VKFSTLVARGSVIPILLAATSAALAQTTTPVVPQYNIGDAVRQADEARRAAPPSPTGVPVLPRLVEPQLTLADKSTLFVRRFAIEGPGLVAEAEIRAILGPYENRKLTLAEIYDAADKITTLYRNQGYLLAKAYVPAQDARRGVLRIKIVPGKYGAVTLKNESRVRDFFLQGVIDHALATSAYIHRDSLERAMLLISDLPGAAVPRVTIASGRQPETSDFAFDVPRGPLIDGYLLADNFGSPYTGRGRVSGGFNVGAIFGRPVATSTTFSCTGGNVNFPDPIQRAVNIAGVDTVGDYSRLNLTFLATVALNEKFSFSTNLRAQKSLSGNLDSSEQLSLTGFWGVRSYDEGLAADSGFVVTPELKYALPDIRNYHHAIGLFTDVAAGWIENPSYTVTQSGYTQLNDVGLGYYATYEYLPGRVLLLKALVAQTYGSNNGAQSYDRRTKGLVQIGSTF
jgi:hemolysin activation/secretion protein